MPIRIHCRLFGEAAVRPMLVPELGLECLQPMGA